MRRQPNYLPTVSLDTLTARADLLRRTRQFFDKQGFLEVQTPLLSADTVVDRHLDPVPVLLPRDGADLQSGRPMWLQTSPEFALKRLLAAGAQAIYEITPAFRIGESGDQHNPEFTMLEWYRCGDSMAAGIQRLADLVSELLRIPVASVVTVASAFQQHAGINPFECDAMSLKTHADAANVSYPESLAANDWDTWFDLLFTQLVQPHLGAKGATVIHDYPASQAALAQVRADDPPVAERFELFVNGVELANGYHELLDADELRTRNHKTNLQRAADGKPTLPEQSQLLAAMDAGLPASVGVALGFDRLVMLATGAQRIDEVICFPIDRA